MSNVVDLDCVTRLDIDPDRVLSGASGKLESCLVVGYDKDGLFYFGSSMADGANALWLLEMAKKKLLEVVDGDQT